MSDTRQRLTRVAAYVRCGGSKDGMMQELVEQMNRYISKIKEKPDWIFAGIYADSIGGTNPEYKRMIYDCENGKIDLILVRSISTFGFHTAVVMQLIETLSEMGVGIQFEDRERMTLGNDELSEDGGMMLTVFNSILEPVRPIKLSEKRITIYGFDDDNCPNENEAQIIRRIFDLYLLGYGAIPIARILNNEGIPAPGEKEQWTYVDIRHILSREGYKTIIVDDKMYERMLVEKQRRSKAYGYRQPTSGPLAERITCAVCGNHFARRERGKGSVWICRTYLKKGGERCHSRGIREKVLMGIINGIPASLDDVENITVYPDGNLTVSVDDTDYEYSWR